MTRLQTLTIRVVSYITSPPERPALQRLVLKRRRNVRHARRRLFGRKDLAFALQP